MLESPSEWDENDLTRSITSKAESELIKVDLTTTRKTDKGNQVTLRTNNLNDDYSISSIQIDQRNLVSTRNPSVKELDQIDSVLNHKTDSGVEIM